MIVGVVLSAGRSSRLGSPKALAVLEGETFVARTVRVLREAGCDELCLVVGAPHARAIAPTLAGVTVLENPDPDRGMLSSLQVGLGFALARPGLEGVVFALVDHPRVRPETVRRLLQRPLAAARRPLCAGRGGHPVVVSASLARALAAAPPSANLRELLAGELEDVEVADPGVVDDLDTPDDLAAIGARVS